MRLDKHIMLKSPQASVCRVAHMDNVEHKQTQAIFTLSRKAVTTMYMSMCVRNSAFLSNLFHTEKSGDNPWIAVRITGRKLSTYNHNNNTLANNFLFFGVNSYVMRRLLGFCYSTIRLPSQHFWLCGVPTQGTGVAKQLLSKDGNHSSIRKGKMEAPKIHSRGQSKQTARFWSSSGSSL